MFGEFYRAYTTVFRSSTSQASFKYVALTIAVRAALSTNELR
jgi:hypothetical protein